MDKFDHLKEKRDIERSESRNVDGKVISTLLAQVLLKR